MIVKTKTDDFGNNTIGLNNPFKGLFNGDFFKRQNLLSDADITAIKAYNTEIDKCVTSQTAFNRTMLNTSKEAQNIVAAANGGTVAINGLTKSSKAAELGMRALSMAGNMIASMVISWVVSEAISWLNDLAHAEENARKRSEELTSSYETEKQNIDDSISKYKELSEKLDNTSLSTSEVKSIKEQLLDIANSFSTSVANATSYSDISVMLYQRVTKNSQAKDVYYPVGIRMSATGNANSAPYVDIWGNKSNSDPDTVYTVPSVRLGYLDGLKCGTYDCFGYGLYADNVYLNGTIISNSGTIGGFKIDNNSLNNGTWGTDKSVLVCTGTNIAKAVGGSSAINGWCFTAGSKFGVTTNGDLYASNANISGTITSEKGKIGKYTITGTSLWTGDGSTCSGIGGNQAFWAGSDSSNDAAFRVSYSGELVATNANITGTINTNDITATSGTISSFKLDSTYLQSSDKTVGLSATETNWAFWAGGSTGDTAKFRVTRAGTLYTRDITATGGTIGGWNITDDTIEGSNTYSDILYTIGMKNVVSESGDNYTNISDQAFIYSDITKDQVTTRTISIRPNGQIHLQGTSLSVESNGGEPGYCVVHNNGFQVLSPDKKRTYFRTAILHNSDNSSSGLYNNFTLYTQTMTSTHINICNLDDYANLINLNYGIYCSKDAFFGGSTEFGNWKISNTRIASSNTISMGAKEAGIMIVNEKDKPYVLVQNSSGDSLFSIEKNGSITHNGNTIGQTYVNSFTDNKAISNAVWANTGVNITLPAGTYVIMGSVHFANAKGGRRAIRFASGSTGLAYTEQIVPVDSNATINSALQCQWIVSPTSQTTYNLQAFQASGGRINMTSSYIKAVRIS